MMPLRAMRSRFAVSLRSAASAPFASPAPLALWAFLIAVGSSVRRLTFAPRRLIDCLARLPACLVLAISENSCEIKREAAYYTLRLDESAQGRRLGERNDVPVAHH